MAKERDMDFDEEELEDEGDGGGRRGGGGGDGGDRKNRRRRNSYCPDGKCFDYKRARHLALLPFVNVND